MQPFVIVGCVAAVVVIFAVGLWSIDRKAHLAMESAARTLGLQPADVPEMSSQGPRRGFNATLGVLRGVIDGVSVEIVSGKHATGLGADKVPMNQIRVTARLPTPLPFQMRVACIPDAFGLRRFWGDRELDRALEVRTQDEEALRTLFTSPPLRSTLLEVSRDRGAFFTVEADSVKAFCTYRFERTAIRAREAARLVRLIVAQNGRAGAGPRPDV